MNRISLFVLCCCALILFSCESKEKKNIVFYDTDESDTTATKVESPSVQDVYDSIEVEYAKDENTIAVPFSEQHGVKLVDVTVNGEFTVPMILDSGCSTTLISIAEARYLYEKGCFSQGDFLGIAQSQIADGSIVENMVINLRQLVIGNKIVCYNVKATVSNNAQAPLLLGNEVLDRAPSYSVDNVNKQVVFKLN
jgi:hypothetical protein